MERSWCEYKQFIFGTKCVIWTFFWRLPGSYSVHIVFVYIDIERSKHTLLEVVERVSQALVTHVSAHLVMFEFLYALYSFYIVGHNGSFAALRLL